MISPLTNGATRSISSRRTKNSDRLARKNHALQRAALEDEHEDEDEDEDDFWYDKPECVAI
jgi:hypothetical protein